MIMDWHIYVLLYYFNSRGIRNDKIASLSLFIQGKRNH